ncbi:hypothetical protein Patl1_15135 [Pistacia atlantica]|uniref:Uncharacterized protein n=1 Tax=Pistacia atlantica TaxID=434234 RepID=A0ACC1BBB1_9ROSI|nr:hypothetical protein Patl1_15135 [Pistacia atlantica]
MSLLVLSLIPFLLLPYSEANGHKFCPATKCNQEGPNIAFPFRLKTQPSFCGLQEFELSCLNNKTLLHLPSSGNYYVEEIDYVFESIKIMNVHETPCSLQSLLLPNLTNSNSSFTSRYDSENYTIVNCTERIGSWSGPTECISDDKYFVYAVYAYESMDSLPSTCRVYQTVNIPYYYYGKLLDYEDPMVTALTTRTVIIDWEAPDELSDSTSSSSCSTSFFKHRTKSPFSFFKNCEFLILQFHAGERK